jgi:phenylalanyl-tRNA synthetase beta chain
LSKQGLRDTLCGFMNTSAAWLNDYLEPPASPEEQAELLTRAGFPFEGGEEVAISTGRDMRQDFEMTSNRGDCTCHVGMAREIAAISGRTLKVPQPAPKATGPAASSIVTVENHEKKLCPLYTARIIKGVKVGPSPQWLQDRLIARGDIPRNNVVDATNFVLFELGQPTHVFDLAKLKGPKIVVRKAKPNEPFLPIGEGAAEVKLSADDLVIADAEDAVAIAGVKGGALSAVTHATTDILIEAATFDPVTVRNTSRRLNISSDSSFRFERGVHPAQVNHAADRLAELILELAGGTLLDGVVSDGAPIPPRRTVSMRCERCRKILGVPVEDAMMVTSLAKLGFEPKLDAGVIHCTVPIQRLDIEREVDRDRRSRPHVRPRQHSRSRTRSRSPSPRRSRTYWRSARSTMHWWAWDIWRR